MHAAICILGPLFLTLYLTQQVSCYRIQQKQHLETFGDPDPQTTEKIITYLVKKGTQPVCKNKPLFLTIANVGSRLYWKLIENFFYTMEKFGHRDCAVLVCISGK